MIWCNVVMFSRERHKTKWKLFFWPSQTITTYMRIWCLCVLNTNVVKSVMVVNVKSFIRYLTANHNYNSSNIHHRMHTCTTIPLLAKVGNLEKYLNLCSQINNIPSKIANFPTTGIKEINAKVDIMSMFCVDLKLKWHCGQSRT